MSSNKERIIAGDVFQYYTRLTPESPADALEMDVVLIAPEVKSYSARLPNGQLNPERKIDLPNFPAAIASGNILSILTAPPLWPVVDPAEKMIDGSVRVTSPTITAPVLTVAQILQLNPLASVVLTVPASSEMGQVRFNIAEADLRALAATAGYDLGTAEGNEKFLSETSTLVSYAGGTFISSGFNFGLFTPVTVTSLPAASETVTVSLVPIFSGMVEGATAGAAVVNVTPVTHLALSDGTITVKLNAAIARSSDDIEVGITTTDVSDLGDSTFVIGTDFSDALLTGWLAARADFESIDIGGTVTALKGKTATEITTLLTDAGYVTGPTNTLTAVHLSPTVGTGDATLITDAVVIDAAPVTYPFFRLTKLVATVIPAGSTDLTVEVTSSTEVEVNGVVSDVTSPIVTSVFELKTTDAPIWPELVLLRATAYGLDAGFLAPTETVIHQTLEVSAKKSSGIQPISFLPIYTLETNFFWDYKTLDISKSPAASIITTGNRPGFTKLLNSNYRNILEVNSSNPAYVASSLFFANSLERRMFLVSPSEISAEYPYGTPAAILECLEFCKNREGYHITILDSSADVKSLVMEFAEGLGGTAETPLEAALRFYIPQGKVRSSTIINFGTVTQASGEVTTDIAGDAYVAIITPDPYSEVNSNFKIRTAYDNLIQGKAGVSVGAILEGAVDAYQSVISEEDILTFSDGRKGIRVELSFSSMDLPVITFQDRVINPTLIDGILDLDARITLEVFEEVDESSSDYPEALTKAMAQNHKTRKHQRVNALYCEGIRAQVGTLILNLGPEYALAAMMGVIAASPQWKPISKKQLNAILGVYGTKGFFTKDQLERLMGAGYILPVQDIEDESAVYILRDVSTDTSTRVFQRRSAGVTEDMLTRHINRVVEPSLGPELLSENYLNLVAMRLGAVEEFHKDHFKTLAFGKVTVITDLDRQRYNIDDTGIKMPIEYTHLEEASSAIIEHIIAG